MRVLQFCAATLLLSIQMPLCYAKTSLSMPSLDRIRKRVDEIVQNGKSLTLKDVIKDGKITTGKNTQSSQILTGSDNTEKNELADVEKKLKELYWSQQGDFIDVLASLMKESEAKAAIALKDKMSERYPAVKGRLMTYAKDLASEEQQLSGMITTVLRQSGSGGSKFSGKQEDKGKTRELFEQHDRQIKALRRLIDITNTLLG